MAREVALVRLVGEVRHVPSLARPAYLMEALVLVAFLLGFAGAFMFRAHNSVTVQVRKVERSWGRADQSVDGAQINPALAGLTCYVYAARKTVVCHP